MLGGWRIKKGQLTYSVINSNITYNLITDDWYKIQTDVYHTPTTCEAYFTKDGKYVLFSRKAGTALDTGYIGLFKLNANGTVIGKSYQNRNDYEYNATQIILFNSNVGINFRNVSENNINKIKIDLFELLDEGQGGELVRNITKTLYTGNRSIYQIIGSPIISPDNKKIFATFMYVASGNYVYAYKIVSFDVDEILQASVGDEISFTEYNYSSSAYTFGCYAKIASNFNCTNIKMYSSSPSSSDIPFMAGSHVETNDEQILGVKYKGMYFHKIQDQVLTAGQPDVSAGKTFIGWMGYPEVGTMETEEE